MSTRAYVTELAHGRTRYRTASGTFVSDRARAQDYEKGMARTMARALNEKHGDSLSWCRYSTAKVPIGDARRKMAVDTPVSFRDTGVTG